MNSSQILVLLAVLFLFNRQDPPSQESSLPLAWNVLVPDTSTMARAWEFPRDPRIDTAGLGREAAGSVLRGFELFTNTSVLAKRFSGGVMTCNNCHPNGGQREKGLPLVGVDRVFPEYNRRAGHPFTLEERIVGCFMRSINATAKKAATVSTTVPEVQDLAAYIRWLSWNRNLDSNLPWRGQNKIPAESLIPLRDLRPKLGLKLFREKCMNCHGEDGQGVLIGDKRPGPLWGPNSWNDGAGAGRTYTLAGIIRFMMPYMDPGSLTDEEAQHIAAYITSQSRPGFPFKDKDYLKEQIPIDAVYYPQLYSRSPFSTR